MVGIKPPCNDDWEPKICDDIFDILDPYANVRVMPIRKTVETTVHNLQFEMYHCVVDFTVDEPANTNLYDLLLRLGLAERDPIDHNDVSRVLQICPANVERSPQIVSSLDSDDSLSNVDENWNNDPEYAEYVPPSERRTQIDFDWNKIVEFAEFDINFTEDERKEWVSHWRGIRRG